MYIKKINKFSLIELLVVIGIIGILVSILLPSLRKAKMEGQRIHCLNNEKQIYLAQFLYVNDHDDHLPFPNWRSLDADWGGAGWLYDRNALSGGFDKDDKQSGIVWSYSPTEDLFYCIAGDEDERTGSMKMTSYMVNGAVVSWGSGAFVGELPSYKIQKLPGGGVFMWEQNYRGNTNDGSNYHDQIGPNTAPTIALRLPTRHGSYETNTIYFDGSANTVDGDTWQFWQESQGSGPNPAYCNPGSPNGDNYGF